MINDEKAITFSTLLHEYLIEREKMTSKSEALQVFVRVRPPISKEIKKETAVFVTGSQAVTLNSDKQEIQCQYDHIFNEVSEQSEVFERVKPLLLDVLSGINGCIFAYGQTSAGKSYTMIGPDGGRDIDSGESSKWGLIPRSSQFLMNYLSEKADEGLLSYEVKASFLQIYNENLYDLLRDSGPMEDKLAREKDTELKIREIPKLKNKSREHYLDVFVSGLSEFRVLTSDDILKIVSVGTNNRLTRSTDFNFTSSRSHAILQLTFEIEMQTETGQTAIIRSKLNLIDLAGSEKIPIQVENNNAKHLKELTSINKSLSALGNVIAALSSKSNRSHIPYRDSKLTRLLQDSLSGNTRTVLIACVAPTILHTSETYSTLQFADRAKSVMLTVQANTVIDDKAILAKANAEISRLKKLLTHALKQLENPNSGGYPDLEKVLSENEKLKKDNEEMKTMLKKISMNQNENNRSRASSRNKHVQSDSDDEIDITVNNKSVNVKKLQVDHNNYDNNNYNNNNNNNANKNDNGRHHQDPDYLLENMLRSKTNHESTSNPLYNSNISNVSNSSNVSRGEQRLNSNNNKKPPSLNSLVSFSYFDQQERDKAQASVPILYSQSHGSASKSNFEENKLTHHISPPKADVKPIRKETVNSKLQNKLYKTINESNRADLNKSSNFSINNSTDPFNDSNSFQIYNNHEDQNKPIKKVVEHPIKNYSEFISANTEPVTEDSDNTKKKVNKFPSADIYDHQDNDNNDNNDNTDNMSSFYLEAINKKSKVLPIQQSNYQEAIEVNPAVDIVENDYSHFNPVKQNPITITTNGPHNRIYKKNKSLFNNNNNNSNSDNNKDPADSPLNKAIRFSQPETGNNKSKLASFMNSPLSLAVMGSSSSGERLDYGTQRNLNVTSVSKNENADTAVNLSQSKEDIGKVIQMFSFRLNSWDRIELVDYEPMKKLHKCRHPDGSIQWLDLSKKPIRAIADDEN